MNSKRTKKPPKWEDMTKEQVRKMVEKKRGCDATAQRVVESFLERTIVERLFIDCLSCISQCHYDDVIEERVILKLCGYPLCGNDLPTDVPKQQFKISFKNNKVYDLTHRKNYCSNYCYRASTFIASQLLTSPLWFREHEIIPIFRLLPLDIVGSPGDAVDLALTEKIPLASAKRESFTTISDFTQASLNDMDQEINIDAVENSGLNNSDPNVSQDRENYAKEIDSRLYTKLKEDMASDEDAGGTDQKKTEQNDTHQIHINSSDGNIVPNQTEMQDVRFKTTLNKPDLKDCSPVKNNLYQTSTSTNVLSKKSMQFNNSGIVGDIFERSSKEVILPPKTITDQKPAKTEKIRHNQTVPIIYVEKCISEWFNLETLIFLLGEEKVKHMVSDKGDIIKEYLNNMANGLYYNATSYDNYQVLCRKLKLLELEDTRYDYEVLKNRPTKPLLDYESLKETSKKMDLKVKAYFAGEMRMEIENEETQPTTEENKEAQHTNLPLVDKTSQNALRRKIVLGSLNKVLPDLLQSLGLSSQDVGGDIRLLINTFNLKANNILFKHAQWYLIAMIMIKLLSIREQRLAAILEKSTANKHMQLLLLSYGQDGGYLERLIMWLTDIDRLLNTCGTSLTVT